MTIQNITSLVREVKPLVSNAKLDLYQAALDTIQEELTVLHGLTSSEILKSYLKDAVAYCKENGYKIGKGGLWVLTRNEKLSKEGNGQWLAAGIELASALRSGHAVCITAIKHGLACVKSCILFSGNGRFKNVLDKRISRTQLLFQEPAFFLALLVHDIEKIKMEAMMYGKQPAIRLNVFSDLPWEEIAGFLFGLYPEVQFYDYTKEGKRILDAVLPPNYNITASYHEKMEWSTVEALLAQGINVAAVFDTKKEKMPYRHKDFAVVNGDEHDFRFLDPKGVIVGLARKGKLSKDNHKGFMLTPQAEYQPTK